MYISCLTFILTAITGSEPAWWPVQCLQGDTSCALFASLYVPMRRRCKRTLTPSTAIQTDKMSKAKEFGSCPDMYRSLNTAELRELLQNDDKMEQIIGLDEKVMSFFCFVFVFWVFFFLTSNQCSVLYFWLTAHFYSKSIVFDVRNRFVLRLLFACVATDRISIKLLICAANIEVRDEKPERTTSLT